MEGGQREEAPGAQVDAMVRSIRRFVAADEAGEASVMAQLPALHSLDVVALLVRRAATAAEQGNEALADHLAAKASTLAGIDDRAVLEALVELLGVSRAPGRRDDATLLDRARAAFTELDGRELDGALGSAHPALLPAIGDALAASAARLGRDDGDSRRLRQALGWAEGAVAASRPVPLARQVRLVSVLTDLFARTGDRDLLPRAIEAARHAVAARPGDVNPLDTVPATADHGAQLNNLAVGLARLHGLGAGRPVLDEAIVVARGAVAATAGDSQELPIRLNNLANRLSDGYAVTGQRELLDEAVTTARAAVERAGSTSRQRPELLANLSSHLADVYRLDDRSELLGEAVALSRQAVAETAVDDGDRAIRLHDLVDRLDALLDIEPSPELLAEAVDAAREAVALTPTSNPRLLGRLDALVALLRRWFGVNADAAVLAEAAELARQSTGLTATTSAHRPRRALVAVEVIISAVNHGDDPDHLASLTEARSLLDELDVSVEPSRVTDLFNRMVGAATGLAARTGLPEPLDVAVSAARSAAERAEPGGGRQRRGLAVLSATLLNRFAVTGQRVDLDDARLAAKRAAVLPDTDGGHDVDILGPLADRLVAVHHRLADRDVLADAVTLGRRSAQLADRDGPDAADRWERLAAHLVALHRADDDAAPLAEAETAIERALGIGPADGEATARRLLLLSQVLADRARHGDGDGDRHDRAIEVAERASRLVDGGQLAVAAEAMVADQVADRFVRQGDRADLDRALASDIAPDGDDDPVAATRLHRRSLLLLERFRIDGQGSDVEAAVVAAERSLAGVNDPRGRARHLETLGDALSARAGLGQPADLDPAIAAFREAAGAIVDDPHLVARRATKLAVCLGRRHHHRGDPGDLVEAVTAARGVIDAGLDPIETIEALGVAADLLRRRHRAEGDDGTLAEACELQRQAIDRSPPDDPALGARWRRLAWWSLDRHHSTGERAALAEAVTAARAAVELGSDDEASALHAGATALTLVHDLDGEAPALLEALDLGRRSVGATPVTSSDLLARLDHLGQNLLALADGSGDGDALEEAITVARRRIRATPSDSAELAVHLHGLSRMLTRHHDLTASPTSLPEAALAARRAVDASDDDDATAWYAGALCRRLLRLYGAEGDPAVIDEAVAAGRRALERPAAVDRAEVIGDLAISLALRFDHTGARDSLDEAIALAREAVESTPPGEADVLRRRRELLERLEADARNVAVEAAPALPADEVLPGGVGGDSEPPPSIGEPVATVSGARDDHDAGGGSADTVADTVDEGERLSAEAAEAARRWAATGERAEIERAVVSAARAVERTPTDDPGRPGRLADLAGYLDEAYRCTGQIQLLERAVALGRRAVPRLSVDDPRLAACQHAQSSRLGRLADTPAGQPTDLEEAVRLSRSALEATDPQSADLPMVLDGLSDRLAQLHRRTGDATLVDEMVAAARRSVRESSRLSMDVADHLGRLAERLALAANSSDDTATLTESVDLSQAAIDVTPLGSAEIPTRLRALAARCFALHDRGGGEEYHDRAVTALRRAVEAAPAGGPERSALLNDLANGYARRWLRTSDAATLVEATAAARSAVAAATDDDRERPRYHANLADRLASLHTVTGDRALVDEAVLHARRALESTAQDGPDMPARLAALANHLVRLHAACGDDRVLDGAIAMARRAVRSTPPDAPERVHRLSDLAHHLARGYPRRGDRALLDEAATTAAEAVALAERLAVAVPESLRRFIQQLADNQGTAAPTG